MTSYDEHSCLSIDELDPNYIEIFKKWIPCDFEETDGGGLQLLIKICLRSKYNHNKYHKYCGFNKFTKKEFDIPTKEDGWLGLEDQILESFDEEYGDEEYMDDKMSEFDRFNTQFRNHNSHEISSICNPKLSLFTIDKEINFDELYRDWKCYCTEDNYSTGFLVFIDDLGKNVHVYGRTKDVIPYDINCNEHKIFNFLIGKYEPVEIFIGKSFPNLMTIFSWGHGNKWDGNSILLRIGHELEYRYLFIGIEIFEFTTDEKIYNFVSSVGNNAVPYPYAESDKWCYCFGSHRKALIDQLPNRKNEGHISYIDNVIYEKMSVLLIAERDSYIFKHEYDTNGTTFFMKVKPNV